MTANQLHIIAVRRNIMGGGNVIIGHVDDIGRTLHDGSPVWWHVASYSRVSDARRAARTGAAIRRAIAIETR